MSHSCTVSGSEFQAAGAEQRKAGMLGKELDDHQSKRSATGLSAQPAGLTQIQIVPGGLLSRVFGRPEAHRPVGHSASAILWVLDWCW